MNGINVCIIRAQVISCGIPKETANHKSLAHFFIRPDGCPAGSLRVTCWDRLVEHALHLQVGDTILLQAKLATSAFVREGREIQAVELVALTFAKLEREQRVDESVLP